MMRGMSQKIFAQPILTFGAIGNGKNFHNLVKMVNKKTAPFPVPEKNSIRGSINILDGKV